MINNLLTSFVLGLLTPTTAVCVLPLYPAFLVYLSNKISKEGDRSRKTTTLIGLAISIGAILFMFLFGLVFTTLLQVSLTKVIGIISPIAFTILFFISILLILDIDVGKFIPKPKTPTTKNYWLNAFLFGFFFGAIVIPCNPLFIAALFTRTVSTIDFVTNLLNFLAFGIGIAFPLILFSVLSTTVSQKIIDFLTRNKKVINLTAGLIMLAISSYYLLFVFNIFNI